MKKKVLLTFLCFGSLFAQVLAQTVTGTVTDANDGLPLIGVNVIEKGTSNGTITDIEGNFSLTLQGENPVLEFSFIGYSKKEIVVGDQTRFDVVLEQDLIGLEEVVVVGYGTMKKSHLTGAISKMETDGLEDIPGGRVDQLLQGRVAGVQIQNTTSMVGEEPKISVRGIGSISADGKPLVIVDGFPMEDGLSLVDAADIESIEVLKDAASAAIYGSRAANGVIIITTKSGSENKPIYNLRASYGVKDYYEIHPMMTGDEFIEMKLNEAELSGTTLSNMYFAMSVLNENTKDTNWQEEALRLAGVFNAQFNVSGGKNGIKYYVSSSYLGDEGIMLQNKYDKIKIRSKIEADLSSIAKFGVSINPSYTKRSQPTNNFTDFVRTPRYLPVYHNEFTSELTGQPVGSYSHGYHYSNKTYTGIDPITGEERTVTASPYNTSNNNPLWVMNNEFYSRNDYGVQSSIYFRLKLAKGLEFKTSNGFNLEYTEENTYKNVNSKTASSPNSALYENSLFRDLLSENTLTYNLETGSHVFDALIGFSIQERNTKISSIFGNNFPTDYIHTLNAAGTILQYDDEDQVTGTWEEEDALVSLFSRFSYSYAGKYLFSASFRGDGSSKFGENNRWGYFPSVSLGWRISEEDFFENAVPWVDNLKLRGSYGITGTDNIPNYANTNMLSPNSYVLGNTNGSVVPGISNTSDVIGNSYLQWEQTNEFNYGIDFSALRGTINLNVDYYYSTTKSLLYERSVNSILGFTNAWSNEGKVRNKGLEVALTTYNIKKNDFRWSTTLNYAMNRNKVLDLGGEDMQISSGERNEMYISRVGDPLIQFYGYKTQGVWISQEEIDNNPSNVSDVPGGLRSVDINSDGVIDANDYTVIGDPLPDFTWGVSNNINYKNFDCSFLFQGVVGSQVVNGDIYYAETVRYNKNFNSNRWIDENNPGDGKTPYERNGINQMLTDYAVEDGDYIALRDITIGYTLPKKVGDLVGISDLRVYLSGKNLLYWWSSDYRGINPEARRTSSQYNSPLIDGYQRGAFPIQRVCSFGVDITF
ncbi:SusC/RagA family TonB-linked outer membrane protein [Anaerophaga thermohalophila]|uniref:SusC/RagA family TonB-linked outer membrane protein n=1 Tax=Anaerophaga thermohalophila TaxID=177400 RepID=UPI000237BB26|nr:TonB-dependent receptor [Anaerophaga thermohalophila]